jgi:diguanylate cyclase (GGDEF)-like protein/PAS domain S-box-containing protein
MRLVGAAPAATTTADRVDARLLDDVLAHSAEGIIIKTLDAIVTHWNPQAAALYGFSADEAIGNSIRQLQAADLSDDEWLAVLERIRTPMPTTRRGTRRRKGGDVVTVEIRSFPLFDTGGCHVGELTLARDITALDTAEKSLSAAQADLGAHVAELEQANARLTGEIDERRRIEDTLQSTNATLQETVSDLQRFNHESVIFSEMAEVLQACLTFDEAFNAIAEYGERLLPGTLGHFFIFRDSRDVLEYAVSWGEPFPGERILQPDACWAMRRGQVHSISSGGRLRCAHVPTATTESVCVPIIGQGQTLGMLHVACGTGDWRGTKRQGDGLRCLRTMADRIGPALANLRLRETLRSLSIRDPLTGLYNRRYLEESLQREIHRASRAGASIAAIMVDVDHFKRFNDAFGHEAGDVVLRAIADLLRRNIRPSDLPCRLGGEELVVIMPDADIGLATARAEKIRRDIRELALLHEGRTLGIVTASFGVATYPTHASTADTLLHAGDTALYRAKAEGRDRVCAAPSLGTAAPRKK